MHVLFWFRKPNGTTTSLPTTVGTIMLRVTLNGKRVDKSTDLRVACRAWNADTQTIRGASDLVRTQNALLTSMLARTNQFYFDAERNNRPLTAQLLAQVAFGLHVATQDEPLSEAWATFVAFQHRRAAVGEITLATARVAEWRWGIVGRYLEHLKRPDLLVSEIRPAWGRGLYAWMRYEQGRQAYYARHLLSIAAQVVGAALERANSTSANPLRGLSLPTAPVKDVPFLTVAELARLESCALGDSLARARDVFAFQCHTGLAWVDVKRFRASEHVVRDEEGREWLDIDRQKTTNSTGLRACPPLLAPARAILNRYGEQLPVPSNQKLNAYIRRVAKAAGIDKHLTTHTGRHTFLELLIERGVSFEAAAAMAGHSSEKMTRQYAKVRRSRVAAELAKVGLL